MDKLRNSAEPEHEALTREFSSMLRAEILRGEMPGASWCVWKEGSIVSQGAEGLAVAEPRRIEATSATIYDLASLTKPLVTTALTLVAVSEGRIRLDDPIRTHIPEISAGSDLSATTWADLLAHRAGLEAWFPIYTGGGDRASYLGTLLSRPLAYEPRSSMIYTDLGFVLLFLALERLWDDEFTSLAKEKLFDPVDVADCVFNPSETLLERVAATELANEKEREMVKSRGLVFEGWRDGIIWGQVNDGNAWYLGGVAGNAGLFGDAASVARLAAVYLDRSGLLREDVRAAAITCQAESGNERRGLGWQLRTTDPGHPAAPLSGASFGHTGFTGTSVWIDPVANLIVVLLTNRIHPHVRESRIQEIRRRANEIAARLYL